MFDQCDFGASGDESPGEIDPVQQVRDYRNAITFARTLPVLDRTRVGAWGTSYSGGHVLVLAATDRRVRCVAAPVPTIGGPVSSSRRVRPDHVAGALARFDADREARFAGRRRPCFSWWPRTRTLRSADMARGYEPGASVERTGSAPLLMAVAREDALMPTDLALGALNRALEPKALALLPGGHFDRQIGPGFERSSAAAHDRFTRHLG